MAEQRLIDANNLIEEIREERCYNCRNFKDMKCDYCSTADYIYMIEDMPAADVVPVVHRRWISVDERLPEEKVNCIVHYKHAYCDNDDYWAIGICFYDGKKFQMDWSYKVTHWMPLPQPPKGE